MIKSSKEVNNCLGPFKDFFLKNYYVLCHLECSDPKFLTIFI